MRNGVVDLCDGTLRPHDPELLLTKMTMVDYVPGATQAKRNPPITQRGGGVIISGNAVPLLYRAVLALAARHCRDGVASPPLHELRTVLYRAVTGTASTPGRWRPGSTTRARRTSSRGPKTPTGQRQTRHDREMHTQGTAPEVSPSRSTPCSTGCAPRKAAGINITVEQFALIVLLDNGDHVNSKTALMLAVCLQRLATQ